MRIYFDENVEWVAINTAINAANDEVKGAVPTTIENRDRKSFRPLWDYVTRRLYVDAPYIKDPTDMRSTLLPGELINLGSEFTCVFKVAGVGSIRRAGWYTSEHGKAQVCGHPDGGGLAQEWYVESPTYRELMALIWQLRRGELWPYEDFEAEQVNPAAALPVRNDSLTGVDRALLLHAHLHTAEWLAFGGDMPLDSVPEAVCRQFARAKELASLWDEDDFRGVNPSTLGCCARRESRDDPDSVLDTLTSRLSMNYPLETKVGYVIRLCIVNLNEWISGCREGENAEDSFSYYLRVLEGLSEEGLEM